MRKTYLITAILLLSAVWAVAQTSPSAQQPTSPSTNSPSSASPSSQQPTTPDSSSPASQTGTQSAQTSTDSSTAIEGCLSGSSGSYTLTDQSGKAWQLAGDTSKLSDHVGHQVRIMGSNGGDSGAASSAPNGAGSSAASAGGTSGGSTFTVKKVKMISSSCSTSK